MAAEVVVAAELAEFVGAAAFAAVASAEKVAADFDVVEMESVVAGPAAGVAVAAERAAHQPGGKFSPVAGRCY